MSMIQEFETFALKGNVVDMAVGVIIGGAFGKIVSSLVTDVIMPPIGVLIGGVDFAKLAFILQAGTPTSPEVVISYGKFVQAVVDFTIVAAVIFMAIKAINSMKRKAEEAPATPPPPSAQEALLREIRDLLKNK